MMLIYNKINEKIKIFRYRRQLKCYEENLEEPPSLVPKLPTTNQDTHRQVPIHTSPDLVMFCHRVYDFRLKRLLQNKLKS